MNSIKNNFNKCLFIIVSLFAGACSTDYAALDDNKSDIARDKFASIEDETITSLRVVSAGKDIKIVENKDDAAALVGIEPAYGDDNAN